MTENVTGVFGFNGRSLTAPGTRVVSANGEDTIRIIGSAAEWHGLMNQMNRYYHPHPPVDDTDDVPVETNTDMIRIDDIRKVQIGDLVHVKDVKEPMECARASDNCSGNVNSASLYDSRLAVAPSWGFGFMWMQNTQFDYAERPKPVPTSLPSFPDEDLSWHWFVGADGTKVLYSRTNTGDNLPWRVEGDIWLSPTEFAQVHPELLPLTELDSDSGSGSV